MSQFAHRVLRLDFTAVWSGVTTKPMKYAQNDTFGPLFDLFLTNFSLKPKHDSSYRRQILKASSEISLETAQNGIFGYILACVQLRLNRSFVPAGLRSRRRSQLGIPLLQHLCNLDGKIRILDTAHEPAIPTHAAKVANNPSLFDTASPLPQ